MRTELKPVQRPLGSDGTGMAEQMGDTREGRKHGGGSGSDRMPTNNGAGVTLTDLWTKDDKMTPVLERELRKSDLLCGRWHAELEDAWRWADFVLKHR